MGCAFHNTWQDGCGECQKRRKAFLQEPRSWDEIHLPPGPRSTKEVKE